MIPMAYEQGCEIVRFAIRKIRFVFAGFQLRRGPNRKSPSTIPIPASSAPDRFEKLEPQKVAQRSS
jgi:hypothetical protein